MMQADKQAEEKMCRGHSRIKRWIDGMQRRTGKMETERVGKLAFLLRSPALYGQGLLLLLLKKKKKKGENKQARHAWTWKILGSLRLC